MKISLAALLREGFAGIRRWLGTGFPLPAPLRLRACRVRVRTREFIRRR